MTNLTIFDMDAEPRARHTDPPTSHEAARKVARSGRADAHKAMVMRIVQLHPGLTYREIAGALEWTDHVEVMRRLNDLERAARVRKGAARECSTNGNRMATWWEV